MSAEEIVQFFQDCLKNADKLQNGKQLIENTIQKVPDFCTISCNIITNAQNDSQFRRLVGFIMKNILKDNWTTNPIVQKEHTVPNILIICLFLPFDGNHLGNQRHSCRWTCTEC